jgi:molybdenum cofactor cytidylyltransferase
MLSDKPLTIGAVVLAAGLSSRMGVQKLLLPWTGKTVIETVVDTLIRSKITGIVVVTGRDAVQIASVLKSKPVQVIYNPDFADGNMVTSLRTGLKALQNRVDAILMVLADQPQMMETTVKLLVDEWNQHPDSLCIPSYQMHRGHPWVIPARLWGNLNSLDSHQTMRDFIRINEREIQYIVVETATILADLDTPEDYAIQKSMNGKE